MVDLSRRLTAWVSGHFEAGAAEQVLAILQDLPPIVIGGQDVERIQASLVISTGGDWALFQQQLDWARIDWRDSLVSAGLGNGDWPQRLDDALGPVSEP